MALVRQRLPVTPLESAHKAFSNVPGFADPKSDDERPDVWYHLYESYKKLVDGDASSMQVRDNREKVFAEKRIAMINFAITMAEQKEYTLKVWLREAGIEYDDSYESNMTPEERIALRIRMDSEDRKFIAAYIKHAHYFKKHDHKIFMIEQALNEELYLTDATRVDDSFLELPFPHSLFYLPHNKLLMLQGHPVRYISCHLFRRGPLKILEILAQTDDKGFFIEEFGFSGGDITPQLVKHMTDVFPNSPNAHKEGTQLASFLAATLLYLNTSEVDRTHITPKTIAPSDGRIPMCSLGRNIKVNRDFSGISSDESSSSRTIHVLKWTVRGHFRRQKVGEGRLGTKNIWIRPYLKGRERDEETTPAKPNNYLLG